MNAQEGWSVIGHIYLLGFPSGKRYVGQTTQGVQKRMTYEMWEAETGSERQPLLFNAIRKYGRANVALLHSFSVYGEQKDLDAIEVRCIKRYNTLAPHGYNLTEGGYGGAKGYRHTEEAKVKIAAAQRGRIKPWLKDRQLSEEVKAKLSALHKGKPRSEETKAKISAAMKGQPKSKEHKAKMRHDGMKGKSHSEDTKAKISKALKGRPKSEEHKAKIAATLKGKSNEN